MKMHVNQVLLFSLRYTQNEFQIHFKMGQYRQLTNHMACSEQVFQWYF